MYRATEQRNSDALEVLDGTPGLTDKAALSGVDIEAIHHGVDRLDLTDFDGPGVDVLRGRHKDHLTVLLGVPQKLRVTVNKLAEKFAQRLFMQESLRLPAC